MKLRCLVEWVRKNEIGLLIGQNDVSLPVFDTTEIHAHRAALLSLDVFTGEEKK